VGVHFVAEKREIPLYRFVLEGPAAVPVAAVPVRRLSAAAGAAVLGRVAVMSPMAEAYSQEDKSPGISVESVLRVEISGLKAELDSKKAANVTLQINWASARPKSARSRQRSSSSARRDLGAWRGSRTRRPSTSSTKSGPCALHHHLPSARRRRPPAAAARPPPPPARLNWRPSGDRTR
jgi:hypothetical protein